MKQAELVEKSKVLGLSPEKVSTHVSRIRDAVSSKKNLQIEIEDTCRIDNGGILSLDKFNKKPSKKAHGICSFVPAAGASSRYYKPLAGLLEALKHGQQDEISAACKKLLHESNGLWPIPKAIASLGSNPNITPEAVSEALETLNLPKGLLPCVTSGETFFQLKEIEDRQLGFLGGSVFVVRPEHVTLFEKAKSNPNSQFVEQGPALSTVRVSDKLEPVQEDDGSLSIVPAGHGALSTLIPLTKQIAPETHAVLIRNIDNIIGTSESVSSKISDTVSLYNQVYEAVLGIRKQLDCGDLESAGKLAQEAAHFFDIAGKSDESSLWGLQRRLFHFNNSIGDRLFSSDMTELEQLQILYNRPVNLLGQVPNTNNDVGGTPVFGKIGSLRIKLCLEVPHASPADKDRFLANPEKATHFNPVFVIAESDFPTDYYESMADDFWLLAEKTYLGKKVYYHETVLYELLGNSLLANVLFLEIPRFLFNPHKSPSDTQGRQISDWA